MLEHGGRLLAAARQYGIPRQEWLDLSTGINPRHYPIPEIPPHVWKQLPENADGLEQAARRYYQCESILATHGAQAAIQALPALRPPSRVGIAWPSYAEHRLAWSKHGHQIVLITDADLESSIDTLDVLVLCNPNNPTGLLSMPAFLIELQKKLASRGGWLVVDESFIDVTPELSTICNTRHAGLIVLRSFGKFFGLAGARLGFASAQAELLSSLEDLIGPWNVNGPARFIATKALADKEWHDETRQWLVVQSNRLAALLLQFNLEAKGSTALFQWVIHKQARRLHDFLAQHAILTRLFAEPESLRFGLPASEMDWNRLTEALREFDLVDS